MKNKHPGIANITQAIKDKMVERKTNNVSIYMPGLDDNLIAKLKKRFDKVDREPFGYIRFEI